MRRRRRRRRLGRRVEASGARSVGWWLPPTGSACRTSVRVRLSPPRSPSPSPLTYRTQPPSSGAAGPLPPSCPRLPTLTALVSPSPARGSRRHDPAGGEQPHHRGDARSQVRERGRRVSTHREEADLTLAHPGWRPVPKPWRGKIGNLARLWSFTGRVDVGRPWGAVDRRPEMRGERLGGMRKQQEDGSKACWRTGDLWDVRATKARTHA